MSEMLDVIAATTTEKKKSAATHLATSGEAAPIPMKTCGRVWYTRPGPLLGAIPAEKTAGIMANPARTENRRAARTVPTPEATKFSSLWMYDEYVITIPIPRDIE